MKKRILIHLMLLSLVLGLVGCGDGGNKITLDLSFGSRTGTYTGDMVDGLPHGQGKFVSENPSGQSWTYEGEFKNGHFEGEGKMTSGSEILEMGTYANDVIVPLTGNAVNDLHANTESLKYRCVEIIGKVFTFEEDASGIVAVQMWLDYDNSDKNTIVGIQNPNIEIKNGDYLKVTGIVKGVFEGENLLGGKVTAPIILANKYEKLSYMDAVMPTLKTVEVNETKTQHGYSITLQKVEFAKEETRVYLRVDNKGSSRFNVYSFNTLLTQNGRQYEDQSNWEADYPEIQSNLLPGNYTEGIMTFPAIEQSALSLVIEANSGNYREDIDPYVFDVDFK